MDPNLNLYCLDMLKELDLDLAQIHIGFQKKTSHLLELLMSEQPFKML